MLVADLPIRNEQAVMNKAACVSLPILFLQDVSLYTHSALSISFWTASS